MHTNSHLFGDCATHIVFAIKRINDNHDTPTRRLPTVGVFWDDPPIFDGNAMPAPIGQAFISSFKYRNEVKEMR